MRRTFTSCAAIILALSCSQVFAQEGGFKDPNTGKVWSYHRYDSGGTWQYATNYAAGFGVWDLNSQGVLTYYDDWRLPTVTELQAAIANGTIEWVNQNSNIVIRNRPGLFWTSTLTGKKPWYVWIWFGPNGEVIQSESGKAEKDPFNYGSQSYIWAFMIRP